MGDSDLAIGSGCGRGMLLYADGHTTWDSRPAGKQFRNYTAGPAVSDTCTLKILASGGDSRHGDLIHGTYIKPSFRFR